MKRILIVDDEKNILETVADNLELEYEGSALIKTALSGKEALEHFEKEDFELLITDLDMPGMSGKQLCQILRASHPKLPILVFSGRNNQINNEYSQLNIQAFIKKPFIDDLLFHVDKVLS